MYNRGVMGTFIALIVASVMLIVLAVTLLFGMQIAGMFFVAMSGVVGPAGVTPDVIKLGSAFRLMGISMVAVPGSIFLALMLGRRARAHFQQPMNRESQGPPY